MAAKRVYKTLGLQTSPGPSGPDLEGGEKCMLEGFPVFSRSPEVGPGQPEDEDASRRLASVVSINLMNGDTSEPVAVEGLPEPILVSIPSLEDSNGSSSARESFFAFVDRTRPPPERGGNMFAPSPSRGGKRLPLRGRLISAPLWGQTFFFTGQRLAPSRGRLFPISARWADRSHAGGRGGSAGAFGERTG